MHFVRFFYLHILLICFLATRTIAQNSVADSLIKIVDSKNGIEKVDLLNSISDTYHRSDERLSEKYAKDALVLAENISYKKGIVSALSNMSYSKLQQSFYKESLELSIKALKIIEHDNEKRLIAELYVNIANSYLNMFNFKLADKNYLHAVKLYKELKDSLNIAIIYTNIAVSFDNREQLDSALFYYDKSFSIYKHLKDNSNYLGLWYTNVGDVYRKQGKYETAIEYQLKAEPLLIASHDDFTLMVLYSGIPYTYKELNQLDKALDYAFKSVELGKKLNSTRELSYSYMALADIYEAKKDLKNQIKYLKIYVTLNDSVLSEETARTITEMQSKYDNDKKEKEIELLNKSKALDEAEIKEHKSRQIVYTVAVVFVLVISIGLVFVIRSKQKANTLLEKQNRIIAQQKNIVEEKNKEISDSINYAERIQRCFLASKDLMDNALKDYFILFQPKDIVSGDFYWASTLSNQCFILATADSTGHGVPGAIMSLLNTTALENAIESGLTEPAEILSHTRKTIKERLKKDGSLDGGKDGMDCSLISFNSQRTEMKYAAANHLIWIVRNNQVIELKGDKMPVGKHDNDMMPFTQNEIELQNGDMIYTLTDGFPDQFGGINGKKFMYKKLKEILVEVSILPPLEQHVQLQKILKDWMKNTEQVDDITLIGIRV